MTNDLSHTKRLYLESLLESKRNQNVNIENYIFINCGVLNIGHLLFINKKEKI